MANSRGGRAHASVDALEQLYRSHYPRYLRLALAVVGSREAAADVVQEAFARALRSRDSFRGEGSVEAWVWRTVTNVALTHARRAQPPVDARAADEPAANGVPTDDPELRAALAAL